MATGHSGDASADLVAFDSDETFEVVRRTAGDHLRLYAEYNGESYRVRYVVDWLQNAVGGDEQIEDLADQFHEYFDLDRQVRAVMEDLPPLAGDVRANVTRLDNAVFVRYYVGRDALFLTLDTEADITGLLDALESVAGT